ncbi:hypothetical protein IscW_ISCW008790 [Ixodes scapularis]|uniref:Uncharacterized protein n=1 Tax=Ixodes scapularis TaxID=6945 RepID=B7Q2I9_IXOSC|nr:hypothetical protein IscW_ISCW008790 [Ixodes scapularis]|eukprot:XP_002410841.1 hypothetical protein IscW_ISCW008790 [Ixodes scapularis]
MVGPEDGDGTLHVPHGPPRTAHSSRSTGSAKARMLFEMAAAKRKQIAKVVWIIVVILCVLGCLSQLCRCIRTDVALPYDVEWDVQPSGKRRFCDTDIPWTRCWVKVLDATERCQKKKCRKPCL